MSTNKRRIVISDIHGHNKTFNRLLEKISFNQEDQLYLPGDFVDRGPDSKGVLDTVMKLIAEGYPVFPTPGNHEDMMLEAVEGDVADKKFWFRNGGKETLASFGVNDPEDIPQRYLDFIETFPSYILLDDCIIVHAGLNFAGPDPLQNQYDMVWIRRWYSNIDYTWLGNRIIVHGHTPLEKMEIEKMLEGLGQSHVINIDAGCYLKDYQGYGHLCAFELNGRKLYFQENID